MRSLFLVVPLAGLLLITASCGDKTVVQQGPGGAPAAPCDSAKCAAGNKCLPLEGVTKCRKTCASNDDPTTSCPFGYTCTDTAPGELEAFCVQNTAPTNTKLVEQKETGQWGFPCQANLGVENPACDVEQGFFCYGISPTDGDAYCTRYDCEKDSDCGAGFGCAKINQTPNVATAKRSTIGEVQNVCLRRTYCSTCVSDIDCPAIAGTKQHCIADASGAPFCTPECTSTKNCPTEARCATVPINGKETAKVCYPRSTLCVGDGSLCSPCRVDTDCGKDGLCAKGEFTTERFCVKQAPGGDCMQCPKEVAKPARKIGCSTKTSDRLPAKYCTGLYSIDMTLGADIGCWTPDR